MDGVSSWKRRNSCRVPSNTGSVKGRQLIAEVRLDKGAAADTLPHEAVVGVAEGAFIAHAADDNVGMLLVGRKKTAGSLGHGVARLHHLLGGRQITADQHINIRNLRHRIPPVYHRDTFGHCSR